MTHHTDAELLPCPFCGCAAHFEMDDDRWEWIECGSCGMEGNRSASLMEDCKPKLAEAWNRRAPAAPVPQGLRKAAQAVVDRWDTPLWKDVPATAVYIADLRAALAAAHQPPEAAREVCATCDDDGFIYDGKGIKFCPEGCPGPNEAAPVQLPEPCGIFNYGKDDGKPTYHHGETDKEWLNKVLDDWVTGGPHRSEYAYTEQQVRDLLAAHGIGKGNG